MKESKNKYADRVSQKIPQKKVKTKNKSGKPVIDMGIWFTLPYLDENLYDHIIGHKHVYIWAWTESLYNYIKLSW